MDAELHLLFSMGFNYPRMPLFEKGLAKPSSKLHVGLDYSIILHGCDYLPMLWRIQVKGNDTKNQNQA